MNRTIETLLRSVSDETFVWVGASDEVREGVWLFENGETFNVDQTYYKWDTEGFQPNGGTRENHLTIIVKELTFNDLHSIYTNPKYGLCEIESN